MAVSVIQPRYHSHTHRLAVVIFVAAAAFGIAAPFVLRMPISGSLLLSLYGFGALGLITSWLIFLLLPVAVAWWVAVALVVAEGAFIVNSTGASGPQHWLTWFPFFVAGVGLGQWANAKFAGLLPSDQEIGSPESDADLQAVTKALLAMDGERLSEIRIHAHGRVLRVRGEQPFLFWADLLERGKTESSALHLVDPNGDRSRKVSVPFPGGERRCTRHDVATVAMVKQAAEHLIRSGEAEPWLTWEPLGDAAFVDSRR